jgi:hypothetical protein
MIAWDRSPCNPHSGQHVWQWAGSNTSDQPDPSLRCYCGAFAYGDFFVSEVPWASPPLGPRLAMKRPPEIASLQFQGG